MLSGMKMVNSGSAKINHLSIQMGIKPQQMEMLSAQFEQDLSKLPGFIAQKCRNESTIDRKHTRFCAHFSGYKAGLTDQVWLSAHEN